MSGFLDTSHLEDLRISLCENTTVFLSSPALKGRLHLDTFIINDRCGSLTTINELFTTLKPGLRFLAYQVGVTPNTESAPRFVKPYDGSEFPFDCDVISRNRDILKYLSHRDLRRLSLQVSLHIPKVFFTHETTESSELDPFMASMPRLSS
ncbi:uncharacterized protein DFL_000554 [Arthrobotrys flagrans]|uniref:Uncharacterized protein n=1 Tax=Arthrobotrys flagrans TaxID=97331 RepID=A0A437AEK3_ARTFL|nr:hypothetical protein DFL_000554 [Arthrobotrys flagrans]